MISMGKKDKDTDACKGTEECEYTGECEDIGEGSYR